MSTFSIRKASISDSAAINSLSAQLGYPVPEAQTRNNLSVVLSKNTEIVFVSLDNEKVTGWIHVFHATRIESGAFAEIGGLVVDEAHRNKGIGKKLIAQVVEWCKNNKIATLRLRSNVIRNNAHRFYQNLGFAEKKEQKVFVINIESVT